MLGAEFAPRLADFRLLAKILSELSFSEFAPTLADNLLHECIAYSPYPFFCVERSISFLKDWVDE